MIQQGKPEGCYSASYVTSLQCLHGVFKYLTHGYPVVYSLKSTICIQLYSPGEICVWDPYLVKDINSLEMRAARGPHQTMIGKAG